MLIGLSRGRYRLTASKTGYTNGDIEDPLRSPGAIIAVASDQRIEDVRVPLVPTSALSGRAIDQQGQAMSGVRVILLQPSYSPNGEVVLQPIGRALTDDSGNYRLSDLVPGRYHLLAIGTTELSMVPTYYPGVSAADASVPLTMLPGIHVSNLEARLFGGERYSIVMRLVSAAPLPDDLRFIVRERGDVFIPTFLALRTDPSQDGHYVVSGIPPGRYRLELVSDVPSQAMRQVIDVDIFNQDIDLGTIPIDTPASITGRVILEVDAPLPAAISLFPLSMSNGLIATSRIHEDGTFTLDRVSDGRYSVLLPSLPSTSYIRSIRLDGTESLRTGVVVGGRPQGTLEVIVGGPAGIVEGRVVDSESQAVANARVVLIPGTDKPENTDLLLTTVTDQTGMFSIGGVPPGEHRVLVWEFSLPNAFKNTAFLEEFESGNVRVTVDGGLRSVVYIEAIPAARTRAFSSIN